MLDGRCAFERFDLDGLGSVAGLLLNIREQLASASSSEEAHTELSRLHHLLNESSE